MEIRKNILYMNKSFARVNRVDSVSQIYIIAWNDKKVIKLSKNQIKNKYHKLRFKFKVKYITVFFNSS